MTTGIRIRPMASGDVDAVLDLAAGLPTAPHWPRTAYITALDPAAWPRRIALVAEDADGSVVGLAIALLIPPQAELETIAVTATHQRQGIACALFAALVDALAGRQITEVTLEVRASNLPAQALYQSLGFQDAGRRPGYYAEPPEDAVLMYRPLIQESK